MSVVSEQGIQIVALPRRGGTRRFRGYVGLLPLTKDEH
jgi:hypothetical protein